MAPVPRSACRLLSKLPRLPAVVHRGVRPDDRTTPARPRAPAVARLRLPVRAHSSLVSVQRNGLGVAPRGAASSSWRHALRGCCRSHLTQARRTGGAGLWFDGTPADRPMHARRSRTP
jgi:hypothetical protein